jgi:hypothetical protein
MKKGTYNTALAAALKLARSTQRAKPKHLESEEQRAFVRRWRIDPRTAWLPACAVPNGGRRSAREAVILKQEGVEPGVPDWLLFAPSPSGRYAGLALEFKSPTGKGRVTPAQLLWHERLRECHWRVEIVTSATDAWAVVCHHLGFEHEAKK